MAGMFDDLIPNNAPVQSGGMFADLIPQQQPQVANASAKGDREMSGLETAGDVVQSLGTGVRAGAEALAGIPGDLQSLVDAVYEAGRSAIVAETPEETARRAEIAQQVSAPGFPTTETIRGVTNAVVGDPRESQTTAGQFARSVGEFLPAAAAGPGSAATKLAVAAGGGIGAEAGGQLTEGTSAEPVARAIGGIAGGLAGASNINRVAKQALKEAPSETEVKQITDALYGEIRNAGIQYNPAQFNAEVKKLVTGLQRDGFRSGVAPKAFSVIDELIERIGHPIDFADADSIRRAAGEIARGVDPTEKKVAGKIIDALDDIMLRTATINTAGKSTGEVRNLVRTARDYASRNIKQRMINEVIEKADTYQSGFESGLRNGFSSLLRSKKGRGFTPEERRAIQAIAKGTPTNNALGVLGRFGLDLGQLGNRATLLPVGAGAGLAAGVDPITGAAVVGLGTIAKKAAQKGTERAAERAGAVIRSGGAAQKRVAQQRSNERLKANLRRALVGATAVSLASQ